MAFTTGTAANQQDLLNKLRKWLTGIPDGVSAASATTGGSIGSSVTSYYLVSAYNASGDSLCSDEVSVTTDGTSTTNANTIALSAVAGATGYKVWKGSAPDGENEYFDIGNTTSFVDTGAAGTAGSPPSSATATGLGANWQQLQWSNTKPFINVGTGAYTHTTSTSAFAWKGNIINPLQDFNVTQINAPVQIAGTSITFQAAIVPISGGVLGTPIFSAVVNPTSVYAWNQVGLTFTDPVHLTAGTQYAILIGAVGQSATFASALSAPSGATIASNPWYTMGTQCQVAASPIAAGNTYDTNGGSTSPFEMTLNGYGAAASITDNYYLVVKGAGAGAGREVYATFHSSGNASAPYYSIACRAAIGYQAGSTWGANPGESPPAYLNLWENSISYWFYANDRRIVIVAKCSSNYMSAYVGMFLPWADPTQYSFPLYVGADYGGQCYYSYSNSARRMFCEPGVIGSNAGGGFVRDVNGQWLSVFNQFGSSANDANYGFARGSAYFMWPFSSGGENTNDYNGWGSPGNTQAATGGVTDKLVPTAQGERIIVPIKLMHTRLPELGALDGVYTPLSSGVAAEQVIAAGGLTLRAFQNINRNSTNDFFLISEA